MNRRDRNDNNIKTMTIEFFDDITKKGKIKKETQKDINEIFNKNKYLANKTDLIKKKIQNILEAEGETKNIDELYKEYIHHTKEHIRKEKEGERKKKNLEKKADELMKKNLYSEQKEKQQKIGIIEEAKKTLLIDTQEDFTKAQKKAILLANEIGYSVGEMLNKDLLNKKYNELEEILTGQKVKDESNQLVDTGIKEDEALFKEKEARILLINILGKTIKEIPEHMERIKFLSEIGIEPNIRNFYSTIGYNEDQIRKFIRMQKTLEKGGISISLDKIRNINTMNETETTRFLANKQKIEENDKNIHITINDIRLKDYDSTKIQKMIDNKKKIEKLEITLGIDEIKKIIETEEDKIQKIIEHMEIIHNNGIQIEKQDIMGFGDNEPEEIKKILENKKIIEEIGEKILGNKAILEGIKRTRGESQIEVIKDFNTLQEEHGKDYTPRDIIYFMRYRGFWKFFGGSKELKIISEQTEETMKKFEKLRKENTQIDIEDMEHISYLTEEEIDNYLENKKKLKKENIRIEKQDIDDEIVKIGSYTPDDIEKIIYNVNAMEGLHKGNIGFEKIKELLQREKDEVDNYIKNTSKLKESHIDYDNNIYRAKKIGSYTPEKIDSIINNMEVYIDTSEKIQPTLYILEEISNLDEKEKNILSSLGKKGIIQINRHGENRKNIKKYISIFQKEDIEYFIKDKKYFLEAIKDINPETLDTESIGMIAKNTIGWTAKEKLEKQNAIHSIAIIKHYIQEYLGGEAANGIRTSNIINIINDPIYCKAVNKINQGVIQWIMRNIKEAEQKTDNTIVKGYIEAEDIIALANICFQISHKKPKIEIPIVYTDMYRDIIKKIGHIALGIKDPNTATQEEVFEIKKEYMETILSKRTGNTEEIFEKLQIKREEIYAYINNLKISALRKFVENLVYINENPAIQEVIRKYGINENLGRIDNLLTYNSDFLERIGEEKIHTRYNENLNLNEVEKRFNDQETYKKTKEILYYIDSDIINRYETIKDIYRIFEYEGITETENLNRLNNVLKNAQPENLQKIIDIVHSVNINLSENIETLNTLYNAQPENLKIIIDNVSKNPDDLINLRNVLQSARPENLQKIIDIVHSVNINLSENIEILNTLYNTQPENLQIIIDNVSKNSDDLINLRNVLQSAQPENLKIIIDNVSKKSDDFEKLQQVLKYAQPKNLQIIIDNVSKNPDDLINLQNVLQSAQPENLQIIIDNVSKNPDDLKKLQKVLGCRSPENLQESITKYNPSIEELLQIQEFIINSEERKTIQKRHPKITLKDLILLNKKTKQTKDRELSLNLLNFRQKYYTEGAELLSNLLKDRTSNSSEIFAKIEKKGEVNEENRIEIICLYSALEYFDENNEFSEEVKTGIREIFKQERSDKDFIYHKLEETLKKVLAEGVKSLDNKEIALIEIVNKKGVFNLPMLENITKFLYQIKELEEREGTFGTTKGNIRERIKKFLIKNKKRSSEDLNEFYNISKNILKTSPSIYNKILLIFDQLQPSDIKYFHEYIFPLYNVELVLHEKNNKHEIQSLIKVNSDIKKLRKMLEENKNKKEILDNKKEELVENIKKLFKDKFGIIKVPDPITKENVESIKNHSLYLANLHDKTPEKETILGFFLTLKINNKRNDFRTGKEDIQPEEFMAPEKTYIIKEYLQKRKNLDIIQGLGYEEKTRKVLQEGEVSKILGSTENISDRLRNIEQDINSLLDNDMYQGEDVLIKNYLEKYPDFGSIMSMKYQQLEGKKQLSEEQNKIIKEFEQEIGKHLSQEDIIRIQKSLKGISPIMNFVKKIQEMELKREIQEFEIMRIPDAQLIRIFNKLGENFSTESGVMGVTEDVQYLEGIIKEDTTILTNEEKNIAKTYIESIKKELNDLYKIQDTTQELFTNFKKHIESSNNEQIKNRLKEIEPLFTKIQEGKKENIVSTMTSDLDIVIKNIRACLSCTNNGCNNDTNLSFGTNNKFFITTNSNNSEKSYADELVILLPSNKGMVFVMDQVYGKRNPDVLVNNTLAILKKIRKMGEKDIGILISNPAISGCGLTKEHLETKMTKEGIKDITIEKDDNITLEVPEQPIGDGYYEFGGISGRGKGKTTTGGLLVHLN